MAGTNPSELDGPRVGLPLGSEQAGYWGGAPQSLEVIGDEPCITIDLGEEDLD